VKQDNRKKDFFSLDEEGHFLVGAAIGLGADEMRRVDLLIENFDITIGGEPAGRVVMELFADTVPKTAEFQTTTMVDEAVYRLPAKTIIISSSVVGFATIFGCYFIAVYLHHVPSWLPMISDCAVSAPEKYLFRIGIITTAGHLALGAVCMYFYLHTVTLGGTRPTDKVALLLSLFSTLCLSIVGAVNERENDTLHTGSAVTFFATYLIYILMTTARLYKSSSPKRQISSTSIAIKGLIATICVISLVGFVIVNFLHQKTAAAISEWSGTICILAYNMSFLYEFTDELWIAAILKEPTTHFDKLQSNKLLP